MFLRHPTQLLFSDRQQILGECLLISRLPGEAPVNLVKLQCLPSVSTAKIGKLDIKRRDPSNLFISLQVGSLFKLGLCHNNCFSCRFDVIQKTQRHDDLIKTHSMRQTSFIWSTCINAVNIRAN